MNIDNEQVEISNYFDTLIKRFKKNKKLSFLKLSTDKKELIALEKKLRDDELIPDIEEGHAIVFSEKDEKNKYKYIAVIKYDKGNYLYCKHCQIRNMKGFSDNREFFCTISKEIRKVETKMNINSKIETFWIVVFGMPLVLIASFCGTVIEILKKSFYRIFKKNNNL
jgi:hypothetical protein